MGYNIKLALRDFWNYKYHKSAEVYLKRWYFWATHSRLDPVIDCAKMIKHHWNGVTNYIKTKIDNGILEGTNSLIQAAKDSARGFRSTKSIASWAFSRRRMSSGSAGRARSPLKTLGDCWSTTARDSSTRRAPPTSTNSCFTGRTARSVIPSCLWPRFRRVSRSSAPSPTSLNARTRRIKLPPQKHF